MWICKTCGHVNDNDLWETCEHCKTPDDPECVMARKQTAAEAMPENERRHKASGRFVARH